MKIDFLYCISFNENMPRSKRVTPCVEILEPGPYHAYHICPNPKCRSLLRVNSRLTHHVRHVVGFEYDPNGPGGSIYSNESDIDGYKCPNCGQITALWNHLGEWTTDELRALQSKPPSIKKRRHT
jgi:hypothetical protein